MQTRGVRKRSLTTLVLLVLCAGIAGAEEKKPHRPPKAIPDYFPYPAALQPQVKFWKKIFATYSKYQVVIHDTLYMDKVYKVLDFRPLLNARDLGRDTIDTIKAKQTKQELERIRAILLRLHTYGTRGGSLNAEEQKIWNLYRNVRDPHKFRHAAAADRLRSQSGLRERFGEGIQISRRYLGEMEEIFRREGVPVELTRLPLVESCFDLRAYSKAAAAGIWQFIPSTGRLYMRVDGVIDERRDPLVSTRAAARLLKSNYSMLGTWPLAITAYNHGPYGMVKAVETLGTRDIDQIIQRYRGKSFGFASKNFYAEFLAALEVEKGHHTYFGPLKIEPPLRYEEVELKDFVSLKHVAHCANTDEAQLLSLNPAFEKRIRSGSAYVPRGYRVRVPPGTVSLFFQRYAALQAHHKASSQKPVFIVHKVRRGQTLGQIARQHRTTVALLQRLNSVKNARYVRVGQLLRVPVNASVNRGSPKVQKRQAAFVTHKVRRGQTLHQIARQYNTTIATLKRLNGVRNAKRLQAGQMLRIPTRSEG